MGAAKGISQQLRIALCRVIGAQRPITSCYINSVLCTRRRTAFYSLSCQHQMMLRTVSAKRESFENHGAAGCVSGVSMQSESKTFFTSLSNFSRLQLHTTLHRGTVITQEQQQAAILRAQMWRKKCSRRHTCDWICNEDDYFRETHFLDFFI